MKVLENAGLISRSRKAQWRFSSLRPEPLREAIAWMDDYRRFWDSKLDRLDAHLRRAQQGQPTRPIRSGNPAAFRSVCSACDAD